MDLDEQLDALIENKDVLEHERVRIHQIRIRWRDESVMPSSSELRFLNELWTKVQISNVCRFLKGTMCLAETRREGLGKLPQCEFLEKPPNECPDYIPLFSERRA